MISVDITSDLMDGGKTSYMWASCARRANPL